MDDETAAVSAHRLDCVPRTEKRARKIDVNSPLPALQRHLPSRLKNADARICHQDVHPAHPFPGKPKQRRHIRLSRYVRRDAMRPLRRQFGHRRRRRFRRPAAQGHHRALDQQRLDNGPANPPRAARHDRSLI